MTCETLQGKYAEKLEREKKKMNKEIELLYKKLDAQDVIINEQTLEIAKLKNRLKNEKKVAQEYLKIEQKLDKVRELIERSAGYKGICTQPETDTFSKILEILGDKE